MLAKYGVANPSQLPKTEARKTEIREKTQKTLTEKYGNRSPKHLHWLNKLDFENEKEFAHALHQFCKENGLAPNSKLTLEKFGISTYMTGRLLKKYGLDDVLYQASRSTQEFELDEFLRGLGIENVQTNARPEFMKGLELDFYLPDQKIAIEHHGLVFHSERQVYESMKKNMYKIKTTPRKKFELAKAAGVKLIQFFEDEWVEKTEICKNMIISRLGMGERIFARNCEFTLLSKAEADAFFKANHISGTAKARIYCGLRFNGTLVTALSIRKTWNKSYGDSVLEIARFASAGSLTVVGGLSKLISHLALDCEKLLTYADLRFGEGNSYEQVGFKLEKITVPNYFYERGGVREPRFKHRKRNTKDALALGPTERQQQNAQGWYAIYDAGSATFLKTIPK